MPIRESGLFAGLAWSLAMWSFAFAINVALAADRLTSPQWRALMTVPGGKWFWTILFACAALILTAGLITTRYKVRAVGLALIAAGCAGIAIFYLIAPLYALGPITLGYWPWLLGAGLGLVGAVVNWRPILWF